MKTFHTSKCEAYPHEKLNTSKGVMSRQQKRCLQLWENVVTNIKRIIIRKEKIETNTDIQPTLHSQGGEDRLLCREGRTVHHREACRGQHICAKCGEKDPGHMEDCLKETRACEVYKKERDT